MTRVFNFTCPHCEQRFGVVPRSIRPYWHCPCCQFEIGPDRADDPRFTESEEPEPGTFVGLVVSWKATPADGTQLCTRCGYIQNDHGDGKHCPRPEHG